MPRVVPSQVISLIDQAFPSAKNRKSFYLDRNHAESCAAIINLIEQLPSELLTLPSQQYTELISAESAIKVALDNWKLRSYRLDKVTGLGKINPISIIRDVLSTCPDEFPSKDTAELNFIKDSDLRENLEIDISATNQALSNGEWKAATVLAGSVIEALLLWVLNQHDQEKVRKASETLVEEGIRNIDPHKNLEDWSLYSFIEVTAKLDIIGKDTAQQARLAKGFRNLIHAGREKRLGQKCDRGTALAAVAAVEFIIKELTLQYSS
jgi:hypothetical protein